MVEKPLKLENYIFDDSLFYKNSVAKTFSYKQFNNINLLENVLDERKHMQIGANFR